LQTVQPDRALALALDLDLALALAPTAWPGSEKPDADVSSALSEGDSMRSRTPWLAACALGAGLAFGARPGRSDTSPASPNAVRCSATASSTTLAAAFDVATRAGTVTIDGAAGTRRFKVKVTPSAATYLLLFDGYGSGDQKPPAESLAKGKSVVARVVAYGDVNHLFFDTDYHLPQASPMDGFVCGVPAAPPRAVPSPSAAARSAPPAKVAKCAPGTTLVWPEGSDSAACMLPCDNTKGCGGGKSCVSAGVAGDDGNPIPHNIVSVCPVVPAPGTPAASATTAAPGGASSMELPNPKLGPCPPGYGDQALLATCNKSCTADRDCTSPFTCQSLGGDPPHNCVDMAHLHMR
jgi:hypothetical protein